MKGEETKIRTKKTNHYKNPKSLKGLCIIIQKKDRSFAIQHRVQTLILKDTVYTFTNLIDILIDPVELLVISEQYM